MHPVPAHETSLELAEPTASVLIPQTATPDLPQVLDLDALAFVAGGGPAGGWSDGPAGGW